ncbi:MAG TPA: helix-turn-helix domain-containing protein [Polyangiaceae bacterium]|nr:helix-turn-helix domain-containing protein [Polyangiaceae bacterium]
MSDQLAVTLTTEQLRELIREAVRTELSHQPAQTVREVLTLREAAEFLCRTPKVVMQLVRAGSLPAHFISEREPRFKRSELLAWLDTLPRQPKVSE